MAVGVAGGGKVGVDAGKRVSIGRGVTSGVGGLLTQAATRINSGTSQNHDLALGMGRLCLKQYLYSNWAFNFFRVDYRITQR